MSEENRSTFVIDHETVFASTLAIVLTMLASTLHCTKFNRTARPAILWTCCWSARSFVPARLISVAQLFLSSDSRRLGCGGVGSA